MQIQRLCRHANTAIVQTYVYDLSCFPNKARFYEVGFYVMHGCMLTADFLLGILFNPEDRSDTLLRNVDGFQVD
jgi:hypothetical protein